MTDCFNYYDISPEISEKTAVWPGDTQFHRTYLQNFKSGGNLILSSFETTGHLGAHVDAPSHYHPLGKGISNRSLNFYLGPCQVITLNLPRHTRIKPKDLKDIQILTHRILFKTNSFPDPRHWNSDFNALSSELVNFLAEKKVILIGIDTPSIDLFEDKNLEAHQAIYKNDMANLEGIVLKDVPDGIYTLIALPLKILDGDASPVRAILCKDKLI